jgi:hypothetical protein
MDRWIPFLRYLHEKDYSLWEHISDIDCRVETVDDFMHMRSEQRNLASFWIYDDVEVCHKCFEIEKILNTWLQIEKMKD